MWEKDIDVYRRYYKKERLPRCLREQSLLLFLFAIYTDRLCRLLQRLSTLLDRAAEVEQLVDHRRPIEIIAVMPKSLKSPA
ncbi:MAG: hypothetical protein LBJ26_08180 [Paenibacillus sp.]|jgi:hypothetical protein|nr:hypothetical protein [Paenibacillus sp.]